MPDQEIRLAVVMNGGVSLAVWMAGVSHELDLIRRATTPGAPRPRGDDEKVSRLWQLMQPQDKHRRLVIDVVAGTSAGGLNGAMLANAIAHNGTLDPQRPDKDDVDHLVPEDATGPWLREVWCHLGELRQQRLLPSEPSTNTGSLLDGKFFEDNLKRVMRRLSGSGASAPTSNGEPHHPVTLFTTASGLGVQQFTATDAAGQEFEVTDHRFLYRFTTDKLPAYNEETRTFDPEAKNCCDFSDPDLLGVAARASASFPVAFRAQREPDALNRLPLRMRPNNASPNTSWLMDGGVLDNAPFGPVLDAIAKGSVSGDVSRFVVYVVPSVGIGANATKIDGNADEAPGWFPTLASALKYPREVDFRSDIEQLQRLHEEADSSWSDTESLYRNAVADGQVNASLLEAAKLLQPTYARGRAAGAVWETMLVGKSGKVTSLDRTATAPLDAEVILQANPPWTPTIGHPIQTLVGNPKDGLPEWPWGLGPAERVVRTVLRATRQELKDEAATNNPERVASLEKQLSGLSVSLRHVLALRERVEEVLREGFQGLDSTMDEKVVELIKRTFARLGVREALGKEIAQLQALPGLEDRLHTALAVEVVSRCTSSRTPDQRSAPFQFVRLGPDASLPFLDEDAQARAKDLGNHILYGSQAGNFGAFGADEWRRWDWLMGRLHAASHLGRLLRGSGSSGQPQDSAEWVSEIQEAICEAEGFTADQVGETLRSLQRDFANTNTRAGVARMLQAMNEADRGRPDHERATLHLGDRVVAVSSGVRNDKKGFGLWVSSIAGRSPAKEASLWNRLARWYLEPTRSHIWQGLTGQPQALEPENGVLRLAHRLPWSLMVFAGLALVGGSVALSMAWSALGALLVAYLAGAVLLAGGLGLQLTKLLMKWRGSLNAKLVAELDEQLPLTSANTPKAEAIGPLRAHPRPAGPHPVPSGAREGAQPVGTR